MIQKNESPTDDLWGGLAAMLVALPSAIAFGVATYAALGPAHAAQGALAGMIGATVLGVVASAWGGAPRLITAPCAPAAAVLSALVLELSRRGTAPEAVLTLLVLTAFTAGVLQTLFGLVGLGRLIKYMPYPVVSGYLSGVGLIILLGQVPKFLGAPGTLQETLLAPGGWRWQAMLVGGATVAAMVWAPRITRRVPRAILGLAVGVLIYFMLALFNPALMTLDGNALVVGPLGGERMGLRQALSDHWHAAGSLRLADFQAVLVPAGTLAVLLSIDALKTCVILDARTGSRHDSNRTLTGQGLGNMASAFVGGMPGAGTLGATMVNVASGGHSRWSGLVEGGLSMVAFLLLASVLAWLPISALAGILIVTGWGMLDRDSLALLRSRETLLDFAVIAAVVVVALSVGLIAASGAGIALAVVLFVRQQLGGSVVARRIEGSHVSSKRVRSRAEAATLVEQGAQTIVVELQGNLFFGNADKLFTSLEPELGRRRYVVLDLRRVQSVDITAAHTLGQIGARLASRGGELLMSQLPRSVDAEPSWARGRARIFDELDSAIEWIEDRVIEKAQLAPQHEQPLELREMELFAQRAPDTLAALAACMETRRYRAGERIFACGEGGDEIFLIRYGSVRIMLPREQGRAVHLASFGRGGFFGEMAFIDHQPRSADAIALTDCEVYALSRSRFAVLAENHKLLGFNFMESLARLLAERLRHVNTELSALQAS